MTLACTSVGIGLRQPHFREVFERVPDVSFVEVHSENFFLDGGASMRALDRAREAYPVSLHGVGLALGSAGPIAGRHLEKLKRLVDRVQPAFVSEHLCWGSVDGIHFNDLLPLPHTAEALDLVVERVDGVQCELKRRILIENISSYVEFRDSDMRETAFLAEVARRSGCGILLDINNLYVNSINFGFDAARALVDLPGDVIGEIHLAGHESSDGFLIDTHGTPVCESVWALYREACRRFGSKPTLIEWDTSLPALDVLLNEAAQARRITRVACEAIHA